MGEETLSGKVTFVEPKLREAAETEPTRCSKSDEGIDPLTPIVSDTNTKSETKGITVPQPELKSAMKRHHGRRRHSADSGKRRIRGDGRRHRRNQRNTAHDYDWDDYDYLWSEDTVVSSSPLLTSTPPIVAKQLLKLYPYLIIMDRFLGVMTWNNHSDTYLANYLLITIFIIIVTYFEFLTKYIGHILLILLIWFYSLMDQYINSMVSAYPTLDDIILIMGSLSQKADLVQAPITILNQQDITRLLFTITFFTPVYIILTNFVATPRQVITILGLYILTYHSPFCKWVRHNLWRFKLIRLAMFYLTGLSLGGLTHQDKNAFRKAIETVARTSIPKDGEDPSGNNKGVKYTFVLYENQRRWIGIGWTASMLSYERECWTDEFLNPTSSPLHFRLPQDESDENQWIWIDTQWHLDKTNDGSIQLNSRESALTSNPDDDEGFVYYDNTWKSPSLEDTFTKYTRRRRWVRTAMFISNNGLHEVVSKNEEEVGRGGSEESFQQNTGNDTADYKHTNLKQRKVSFSEIHNVHILPLNGYMDEDDMSS